MSLSDGNMPEVILDNVTKTAYGKTIVQDVSLRIPDKSLYCILGPPASGKSMLMRLIAGLDVPDKGRILFDEKDVTDLGPNERNVAVVFQDFALYPHLSAFDNIASPLKIKGFSINEVRKKVEEVAKLLKIDHRLTHFPSELSGGELQRVAIARALAKDAEVILLDEPLIRLDYKIREDMRGELYKLQKEIGKNVILISSDPIDAMSLAEEIAIMISGKVIQTGTRKEIYERPLNIFVGRYFGAVEMNILDVDKVFRDSGKIVLETKPFKIELPFNEKLKAERIKVGIRPEHLFITELASPTDINFKAKVVLTEVIGSDTIIHLDLGLNEYFRVFIPAIYKNLSKEIKIGFNIRDVYIFSSDGEFLARGSDLNV